MDLGEFVRGVPPPRSQGDQILGSEALARRGWFLQSYRVGAVPLVHAGRVAGQAVCLSSAFLCPLRATHPVAIRVAWGEFRGRAGMKADARKWAGRLESGCREELETKQKPSGH